ncbi:S26 family signal peptidase [Paracoccus jeotgali]|uniref:S26 family signal peptidase n=1 Tax=Paracoccus jeotgali TaxID=2065379 RepID=A0A2K9MBM9_9RHOB|nr:S26 family signal peptidase [Paracoccus jeotgali]AUM73038.1 S26 family signal peptidase [Paracoccus jeotgali]
MKRRVILLLAAMGLATLAVPSVAVLPAWLIWNASASVPLGLYWVERPTGLDIGDLVAVMPPAPLAAFMVTRGYIGADVPLLKHVAGLPGQRICRIGATVIVDDVVLAQALPRDRLGRDLPDWQGCRLLREGEIFLMNREVRDSLDGRYFGPLPADAVIGMARPIWVASEPAEPRDGRFIHP